MKNDIRRQTFSKPAKPSDEEIKKLTADEIISAPPAKFADPPKTREKNHLPPAVSAAEAKLAATGEPPDGTAEVSPSNPFLMSRAQASGIGIEKTGYRLRSEYMDLLKLVKRMKKGHTLEAVLDDALTFYFENSDDGRKALKQRRILDSESI